MFGIDAVLLSDFAAKSIRKNHRVIDLGTGTGIIPLLLETSTPASNFTALEIQKDSADLARLSVEKNALQSKIKIVHGDLRDAPALFTRHSFDVVVCNPPYTPAAHGKRNLSDSVSIARHEICCNLDDVISAADFLLAPHGHFFMIHVPFRLPEILCRLQSRCLEAKVMRLVQPFADSGPNLVLLEARKNARPGLKIMPNLIVRGVDGGYTSEIRRIYGLEQGL